ncbi:MAG: carboxy-S-adenosyl-L-methionine synthase CmoA [Candidatus Omnitrophica bacterium]|nr:carboxy-S-adenosyl-L-methionine synthase CmoA [Candidatus Omnitrophota bacterium]
MENNHYQDRLYSDPQSVIRGFRFDESVAKVFDEMIHRSVPGYPDIVKMTGVLAHRYLKAGTNGYDLGCSLGTVSLVMRDMLKDRDCRIIAVDSSEAMTEKCRQNIDRHPSKVLTEVVQARVQDVPVENASFVVLNLVLQFIPVEERSGVIRKIFDGMRPGGALILTEKICFSDSSEQDFATDLYHEFKALNGYSNLEISQKRAALENVLIPETIQIHRERLNDAGFRQVFPWFRCFNFISIIALKS